MTSRDFCYWLQGFFEIAKPQQGLSQEQLQMIQRHLNMVFIHEIDPSMGDKEHQDRLNEAHTPSRSQAFDLSNFRVAC
jgi:hypothetical protein